MQASVPFQIKCFWTSIWDETLYRVCFSLIRVSFFMIHFINNRHGLKLWVQLSPKLASSRVHSRSFVKQVEQKKLFSSSPWHFWWLHTSTKKGMVNNSNWHLLQECQIEDSTSVMIKTDTKRFQQSLNNSNWPASIKFVFFKRKIIMISRIARRAHFSRVLKWVVLAALHLLKSSLQILMSWRSSLTPPFVCYFLFSFFFFSFFLFSFFLFSFFE